MNRDLDLIVDKHGKTGKEVEQYGAQILMFSPVFHTTMLFWAAKNSLITDLDLINMMSDLDCYPEGPTIMENWRTPIHAASQTETAGKENSKLYKLMDDVRLRYDTMSQEKRFERVSKVVNFKVRWAAFLKQKKYNHLRMFWEKVWTVKMARYAQDAGSSFNYNFQDQYNNTPLHLAS